MIDTKRWANIRITKLGNGFHAYGDDLIGLEVFDKLYEPMEKWCEENCNGRFKILVIDEGWIEIDYIGYSYRFENDEDAVAFKLRWI